MKSFLLAMGIVAVLCASHLHAMVLGRLIGESSEDRFDLRFAYVTFAIAVGLSILLLVLS